uniref:Histidine acid phosphatase n=1 Tax=Globisporangium ultimum (strain ATCC 200006 / CBS 805.95 / DAOM BR144) TaxID=431595 RepID=K3WGU2_GLOUD
MWQRALLFAGLLLDAAAATSQLQQVIVLSRHGVRGPYGLGEETVSEATFDKYVRNPNMHLPLDANSWGTSETDDPQEIVSPKLTKHGFNVVKLMGEYFRNHLYSEFLDAKCDTTFAYADANQRDNLTAQAFMHGLYPTCPDLVPITAETRLLFEQGQDPTANCPVTSRTIYEGIAGANDTRYVIQNIRNEITEINDLLECCASSVCSATEADESSNATCGLFDIPTQWNGAFYAPWKDTFSTADYFSEFWLLQSLNNMTLPAELSFEKILALSRVHKKHMDLVTNEVNSASFGATLLAHLTASFEQSIIGTPLPVAEGDGPRIVQPPDNRFLFYAAHDINLLYVRNLLRLQWYTKGWHPHQPVPGSMLVFELYSTQDESIMSVKKGRGLTEAIHDKHFVKLYFVAASPDQMRNGEALSDDNPPDRVSVIIPSCSKDVVLPNGEIDVRCPFSTFKKLIGKTLKHECVADTLQPFVDSLLYSAAKSDDAKESRYDQVVSFSGLMYTIFGVLVFAFFALVIRHRRRMNSRATQKREYGTLPQVV